jgi:hypothetical protein
MWAKCGRAPGALRTAGQPLAPGRGWAGGLCLVSISDFQDRFVEAQSCPGAYVCSISVFRNRFVEAQSCRRGLCFFRVLRPSAPGRDSRSKTKKRGRGRRDDQYFGDGTVQDPMVAGEKGRGSGYSSEVPDVLLPARN